MNAGKPVIVNGECKADISAAMLAQAPRTYIASNRDWQRWTCAKRTFVTVHALIVDGGFTSRTRLYHRHDRTCLPTQG